MAPVDAGDEQALERRRRLEYTRLVRSEIVDALQEIKDEAGEPRLDVWLDQMTIAGDDDWTARLHWVLGSCDGAVVLLDTVSAESEWVRKEATILTWRQSMASDVLVVPVYLGDFEASLVEQGPWRPIGIRRLQGVRLATDTGSTADAKQLAKLVAERFRGLQRDDADTPMGQWVADLGGLIATVRPPQLRRAAKALGIADAEWNVLSDPHVTMAHHLLLSNLVDAYDSVLELLRGLGGEAGKHLIAQILPIWVSPSAAAHLHASVVSDGARLILVNLRHQDSAREYLDRAWCGRLDRSEVASVPCATGEDETERLSDVEASLRAALGFEENEQDQLEAYLDDTDNMFVLLGAADGKLVGVLRAKYEKVRLLVHPGHDCAAARTELTGAVVIEPLVAARD
jgi:hypothetical protein